MSSESGDNDAFNQESTTEVEEIPRPDLDGAILLTVRLVRFLSCVDQFKCFINNCLEVAGMLSGTEERWQYEVW